MRLNHLEEHIPSAAVRCSSLTAGALLAVFLVGATPANAAIVWSGEICALVTPTSSYTMAITEGGNTFSWNISLISEGQFGVSALFTPLSQHTGVAAELSGFFATRFNFEQGIGQANFFRTYPTNGSSNAGLTLHDYGSGTGNFTGFSSAPQYAGFSFGGPLGTAYFGWVSLTLTGENMLRVQEYAYNNGSIGAGMIPAPGAVALLGLAGVAGKRRRR